MFADFFFLLAVLNIFISFRKIVYFISFHFIATSHLVKLPNGRPIISIPMTWTACWCCRDRTHQNIPDDLQRPQGEVGWAGKAAVPSLVPLRTRSLLPQRSPKVNPLLPAVDRNVVKFCFVHLKTCFSSLFQRSV